MDSRLLGEAARFGLRFACDDCVHFDLERQPTCGHGWPIRLRRSALDHERRAGENGRANGAAERDEDSVSFCKEFELS